MLSSLRKHGSTMVVAMVTAAVTAAAPAIAFTVASYAKNANKVDGYHANQLVRLGGNLSTSTSTLAGSGVILTATIKAPYDGSLMITASSDSYDYVSLDYPWCSIAVDGIVATWTSRMLDLTNTVEENCSTDGWGLVSQGTHTVQLVAAAGSTNTIWGYSNISVLYVPFGYNGGTLTPGTTRFGVDGPTVDKWISQTLAEAKAATTKSAAKLAGEAGKPAAPAGSTNGQFG